MKDAASQKMAEGIPWGVAVTGSIHSPPPRTPRGSPTTPNGAWRVHAQMAGMMCKERLTARTMDKTSELQIYGISREDFEKPGRSTQEAAQALASAPPP
jgi:hypothetical protein